MKDLNRLDPIISQRIITWFHKNGRRLPWRDTADPYYILVSEVMLQQTQVNTVIPYYLRFIESLPTIEALASASDDTLHFLWEGLGYYSRVMRLRQFAMRVVDDYEGLIPAEKDQLLKLPGIGPYTCGALLSFAYHKREAALDGNVKRVISRLLGDPGDITKAATIKSFTEKVEEILPDEIYPFNQGMIELGALICKPSNPECEICPIQNQCRGKELNIQNELPNKPKKVKQKAFKTPVFIFVEEESILFVKRGSKGLLSQMWGLPIIEETVDESEVDNSLTDYLLDIYGVDIHDAAGIMHEGLEKIGYVKHVFSHRIWNQHVYRIEIKGLKKALEDIEYPEITWKKPGSITLPTAFKKSLELLNP